MPFKDALKKIFIYLVVAIVIAYAAFRLYPLLHGPEIVILTPENGETIREGTFIVSGIVKNAKIVKIFDREMQLSPNGNFEERVVFTAPYTRVIVTAIDDWGREIEAEVTVIRD